MAQGLNEEQLAIVNRLDITKIASAAGGLAFMLGWFYNIGFFVALNYKYMEMLTVNDHVLSTVNALPVILVTGLFALAIRVLDRKMREAIRKTIPVWFVILLMYLPFFILFIVFRFWECVVFLGVGIALSIVAYAATSKTAVVPESYRIGLVI